MAIDTILATLLSLAAACILQLSYRVYRRRRWFKDLPQPPHSFFWGHLKVMGEVASSMPPNTHPQAYLTAIAQKYKLKGIFYIDLWPIASPQVVLTDPELMTRVTVNKPLQIHKMADDFMAPIVGHNVIAVANGPVWKQAHNAMAPGFSKTHIRSLTGVMVEEIVRFREALDRYAQDGDIFSMEDVAARLIFDVIGQIIFNFPLHAQTKGSLLLDDLREMIHLADAQLSYNPLVKFSAFFRRRVVLGRLDPAIVGIIKERLSLLRREKIVPSKKEPLSILDLMLREHLSEDGNKLKKNESEDLEHLEPHFLQLLVTNVKGLLLGGHGTTTDTLCFIYILLSKHPEVVQKLREEHTRVFHRGFAETVDMLLSFPQKTSELEYTNAVIKETLRLFPVGFGVRKADDGATLNYNGQPYPIDNDLAVIILAHALHYDPSHYEEPTKFRPERFLDPIDNSAQVNFRTFGRGQRACLGQSLATTELAIILLLTLRDYDFECADLKPNAKPRTSFTDLDTVFGDVVFQELGVEAKPRGSVPMKIRRRALV